MIIQKNSGWMMEWTSHIHNAIGVILFWGPLSAMFQDGVWNSVDAYYDRAAAFWFLGFGALMFFIGRIMRWITEENRTPIPRFVGMQLFALSVVGAIFMPISGFWLVIPQGLYILRNGQRASAR